MIVPGKAVTGPKVFEAKHGQLAHVTVTKPKTVRKKPLRETYRQADTSSK